MKIKLAAIAAACVLLSSCAYNRAVIKYGYDFGAIRTVRVGTFISDTAFTNSGDVVQNAFMRQLMAAGFIVVTDPNAPADVVVEGSVIAFQPDQRYLVNMGRGGGRGRGTTVTPVGGSGVYDLGPAFGMGPGNRIVASNATVGVYAFMVDIPTGQVVWSNSYTYEGLDLTSALASVTRFLVRSIPRAAVYPQNSR